MNNKCVAAYLVSHLYRLSMSDKNILTDIILRIINVIFYGSNKVCYNILFIEYVYDLYPVINDFIIIIVIIIDCSGPYELAIRINISIKW